MLRGTGNFDAASSVVPNFPGGGAGAGAGLPFFSFPALTRETLEFLLRRRVDLEGALLKLEARLDSLGAARADDPLTQSAARVAEALPALTAQLAATRTLHSASSRHVLVLSKEATGLAAVGVGLGNGGGGTAR